MRTAITVLVLVVVASSARADGPIVVRAGLGISRDLDNVTGRSGLHTSAVAEPYGPGLSVDVGYRFMPELAAGIHAGVSRNERTISGGNMPVPPQTFHLTRTPFQLGVGVHWSMSRFWIAPWVGMNDGADDFETRRFAYGVGLGVDAYVAPTGHRVGAYFDAFAEGSDDPYNEAHRYVSVGIAYRYW